jgi:hypothetical protein
MNAQDLKRIVLIFYYHILNFFLRLYYLWAPYKYIAPPPTILDITDKYVETQKTRFITLKTSSSNVNVESVFYDKKAYQELMKEPENWLEQNWRQRILFESTPRGNIIMFYHTYKQGFAYYSDSYNLPYNLLNAVAMKYVSVFCCRDFFMDDSIFSSPLIKIHIEEEKKPTAKSVVKKFSIDDNMVKTRSMKKALSNPNARTTQAKTDSAKCEPEYNLNRFIALGKMVNFEFTKKPKEKNQNNGFKSGLLDDLSGETSLQKKVMDYKAFKSLRSTTTI